MLSHTEKGGWKFYFQQECPVAFRLYLYLVLSSCNSYLLLNHYRSHGKTKGAGDPIVIIASQAAGAIVGERD